MKRGRGLQPLKTLVRTFKNLVDFTALTMERDFSKRYRYDPALKWNSHVEQYFIQAYGAEHFSRISKALTRPSCYSCVRVNTLKSTSDAVIDKLREMVKDSGPEIGAREADIADSFKDGFEISKCSFPGLDYVVFVKGSGPHDINYGYTCDKPTKEVIVSRKCAEAVLRGAQIYVPGVMACSAHVEKGDIVSVSVAVEQPCSDGGWGLGMTRGTVLQGSHVDPYFQERSGLYIGQGAAMLSRASMFRVSEGVAVDMDDRVFKLPSFHNVLEGEIFLQNLPSIITAHALDPQSGEQILDMCAAPGGKTTALAILMKDRGEIVAADRSHNKVLEIKKLTAELGLTCITTYKLDALKAVHRENLDDTTDMSSSHGENATAAQESDPAIIHTEQTAPPFIRVSNKTIMSSSHGENATVAQESDPAIIHTEQTAPPARLCKENGDEKVDGKTYVSIAEKRKTLRRARNGPGRNQCLGGRVENSKGFAPNSFDRVLLDAPCSALGLRPRLFSGEETVHSLRNHAKYQRRMFDQAVQLARPGGTIVYSTCTINPGENEALVRYALDKYKYLSLAPQHPKIGGPGLIGRFEFADGYVEEWLRPGEEELVQRFDPSSPLDTIGFFIAKFHVGSKDT